MLYLINLLLIVAVSCSGDVESDMGNDPNEVVDPTETISSWSSRADSSFNSLNLIYWNESKKVFNTDNKKILNTQHYWWQAHALDAVIDAAIRLDNPTAKKQVEDMVTGFKTNISTLRDNEFFDDREWMALALVRAYEVTGKEEFLTDALDLWTDIKKGWNSTHGGGIAWQESQLYYKNSPSNAPAAILAFRLYKINGDATLLSFGKEILSWMEPKLVDPVSGIVWDGVGRNNDNEIDGDQSTESGWRFTYNQGVYIGALVELYDVEKDPAVLIKAEKTVLAIYDQLTSPTGIVEPEGSGDGGLFKGIMIRYMAQMAMVPDLKASTRSDLVDFLIKNGEMAWASGRNSGYPFIYNEDWRLRPSSNDQGQVKATIDLTVALSGVFLLESLAQLENAKIIE